MAIDVTVSGLNTVVDVEFAESPSDIPAETYIALRGEKGDKGDPGVPGQDGSDGADGADGQDGFSPIATVSKVGDTATISITDENGTTTATVTDGADGQDGVSPSATVSKVGDTATITITDANGTTTATISDGTDGTDGQDGTDGVDGFSPIATVTKSGDTATISITDENGTTTATVSDGTDGQDGQDGRDGVDGTDGVDGVGIVSITKTATVGLVDTYTILYSDGTTSTFDVTNGQNGSGSVADVWVDGSSVLDGDTAKIDLTGKSDVGHTHTKSAITDFPTTVSSFTNDAGYITGYTETDPIFSASAASGISSSDISTWNGKSDFSGDYDDLSNKPTIPSDTGDLTNGAGFITSSDIPVTDVTMDGSSVVTSGVAEFETSSLIDIFYPVGSYYETSDTSFNPNVSWGGTWSLEIAGQVHISAGTGYSVAGALTNTSDGGATTVTLNSTQIPSHSHTPYNGSSYAFVETDKTATLSRASTSGTSNANFVKSTASLYRHETTGSTGGGQAHNNMQPYIIVNRWHRTA